MPKIAYIERSFSRTSRVLIDTANDIIAEYAGQGFDLTLRQLYYQFVARGLIANKDTEYKRLGSVINDARLAGKIDWYSITDRTRNLRSVGHFRDIPELIDAAVSSYRLDRWQGQPTRVEVWIEKDALVGVIAGVCDELDVPYFSCRGYTSQSEMWVAGRRHLLASRTTGARTLILHLGDHDPSGIDMTRDIADRLFMFSEGRTDVRRIALTMDQVNQYQPPPNPAKLSDSRASDYVDRFGDESWELDALDPATLAALIREHVEAEIDRDIMDAVLERETSEIETVSNVRDAWDMVAQQFGS